MKTGDMVLWWSFITIGFMLINITELAPGVSLNTGVNAGISITKTMSFVTIVGNGFQDYEDVLNGDLLSFELVLVKMDFLGEWKIPAFIGKPINFFLATIDVLINLDLLIIVLIINAVIGPTLFFRYIFYEFIPTQNSLLFGTLIGLGINLVLLWDIINLAISIL